MAASNCGSITLGLSFISATPIPTASLPACVPATTSGAHNDTRPSPSMNATSVLEPTLNVSAPFKPPIPATIASRAFLIRATACSSVASLRSLNSRLGQRFQVRLTASQSIRIKLAQRSSRHVSFRLATASSLSSSACRLPVALPFHQASPDQVLRIRLCRFGFRFGWFRFRRSVLGGSGFISSASWAQASSAQAHRLSFMGSGFIASGFIGSAGFSAMAVDSAGLMGVAWISCGLTLAPG